MTPRGLYGIVHATTRPAHADYIARDTWLRDQILKGSVNVSGPFLRLHLGVFLGRQLVKCLATAFAEAAQIKGEHVDPRGCQLTGQVVPYLALPVALVQQQNTRTGLGCCEVGCFEKSTVGR